MKFHFPSLPPSSPQPLCVPSLLTSLNFFFLLLLVLWLTFCFHFHFSLLLQFSRPSSPSFSSSSPVPFYIYLSNFSSPTPTANYNHFSWFRFNIIIFLKSSKIWKKSRLCDIDMEKNIILKQILNKECGGIYMVQDSNKWLSFLNTVISFRVI